MIKDNANYCCESGNANKLYEEQALRQVREKQFAIPDETECNTHQKSIEHKGLMYLGRHWVGKYWVKMGKSKAHKYGIVPRTSDTTGSIRSPLKGKTQPNGKPVGRHKAPQLIHLGNIAYRVGNKPIVL